MVKIMGQFDIRIDRRHTRSVKWDGMDKSFGTNSLLPMWVADMDFPPPEEVLKALQLRMDHGIFGYTLIEDSTYEAIIKWVKKRHSWSVTKSQLLFSPGVVPSLGMAIQAFTQPGGKVLLQSPVYTPFFHMAENNMREVLNSPLVLENGRYVIDFADLEEKLQEADLFLLCSPHNPGGRVWNEEELRKIGELCVKHDVVIVSDEIHCDLTAPPHRHIPIASLDKAFAERTVTCMAPSKTFNLAGIQSSFIIVPNPEMKAKLETIQSQQGFFTLNAFGIIGMEAAYQHGELWLDELLEYLKGNVSLVKEFIGAELPALDMMEPEGGYLIWIDCRRTGLSDEEIRERLLGRGRLALNFGNSYGPGGEGFIRMNIACPRETVREGLERLKQAMRQT